MNVLIFPADSEIAREVFESLRYNKDYTLVGGSSKLEGKGSFLAYEKYIELPLVTDPSFTEVLKNKIKENNIQYIFPCHDTVILPLKTHFSALTITHPTEILEKTLNKKKTFKYLEGLPFIPHVFATKTELKFPSFVKPISGFGSKGARVLGINDCVPSFEENIFTEFLPGKEYTIDCFSAKGNLLFCGTRERVTTRTGISEISKTVYDKKFNFIADSINDKFKKIGGFDGAWFFQVKEDLKKNLKLLEIGPRVSGGMGMYRMLGVNFPELSILTKEDTSVEIKSINKSLSFCKFFVPSFKEVNIEYNSVYVDFDDTLYFHKQDKLNLELIKFLYRSIEKNKKLYLLTRSKNNFKEILRRYKLDLIWDEIIHITDSSKKEDFIKDTPSILIDDSFSERNFVKRGIYSFDLSQLDLLNTIV